MYTDETLLTYGRYSFTKICRVPAVYLLNLYKQKFPDKELLEYVENNMEKIKDRIEGRLEPTELVKICKKISYASEKNAKADINKIRLLEQENKKPVRAYECEKCGGWHLTSIPYENWQK